MTREAREKGLGTMSTTIPPEKWRWYGNAGHFICGSSCRFHLCTEVGAYLVSTGDGSGPEYLVDPDSGHAFAVTVWGCSCCKPDVAEPHIETAEVIAQRYSDYPALLAERDRLASELAAALEAAAFYRSCVLSGEPIDCGCESCRKAAATLKVTP